jgi:hypothetical protein
MAVEMATTKAIPTHSKFTSELNVLDPDDSEEMRKRVFGRDYRTDQQGNPISADRGSDAFYVSDANLPADPKKAEALKRRIRETFNAHIQALTARGPNGCADPAKGPYLEAADIERSRINALRIAVRLQPF